jgi:hypothetical protein
MFTAQDYKQFEEKNISPQKINMQLENFRKGFSYVRLSAPATPGHGIGVLDEQQIKSLRQLFDEKAGEYLITKMVPASGAASRMFKGLHAYMESTGEEPGRDVLEFIIRLRDFAFYPYLETAMRSDGLELSELRTAEGHKMIIRYLLTSKGLDYASLPKGLLYFHRYENAARTAMEEHLAEGLEYCLDRARTARIHFTVSPEHMGQFREKARQAATGFENKNGIKFSIGFSVQKPSTDTIAVDMNNKPFRNPDESIVFRPGGHGALIENLNELDCDIAFIKNIDNVVPDRLKGPTYLYKKVLGGLMIQLMEKIRHYMHLLESGNPDEEMLNGIIAFCTEKLDIRFANRFQSLPPEEKQKEIFQKLNRPIRVCGMVKNEGEPGGGPFWVAGSDGKTSLQIVESSQIDMNDEGQLQIVKQSTHFNPVDLVCCLKDHRGQKFDLGKFTDPATGFISVKSKDGKDLKAQELPGLWNGAMADWITLFIEVPIETFNPVKTVNDLLRPQHQ